MASNRQNFEITSYSVRGLPIPNVPWVNAKNVEDAMDYEPKDGDSILASYPKTGTTWLQYILMQIVSKGTLFPCFYEAVSRNVPYMEMTGIAAVEDLVPPRLYRHHLPYSMVQKNSKSKTVYIYRHPEDTVVSFYHFCQNLTEEITLNVEEFFDSFVTGNIPYGSYFQHVLSFYKHREDPNLLLVSYETLHANRREEILRIAKFLDESHYTYLAEHEEILNKIIEHTSFDYMKKNLSVIHPGSKKDVGQSEIEKMKMYFFRKGIVGDGKMSLTRKQQDLIKAAAETVLKGTSILQQWYPNEPVIK